MGKNHMKRINAPKSWAIDRKRTKWITKPLPGSQSLKRTISVNTILKEMLKEVNTSKEVKTILNKGLVSVNGKIRKKVDYPVSLLDTISIKDEYYRLLINNNGKLFLHKISKEDASIKPRKVIGKKILKGNKTQINFMDGACTIKEDNKLKSSDTVLFSGNKEKEILHFEKGNLAYITEGKRVGKIGILKEILPSNGTQTRKIKLEIGKEVFEIPKNYVIIIGKSKPAISISNE